MIITSDSGYINTGSKDGTINVFCTVTGQLFKSIGRVHDGIKVEDFVCPQIYLGKINALAFGPLIEGTASLISVSDDRAIKILDWKQDSDSFHFQDAHEGTFSLDNINIHWI